MWNFSEYLLENQYILPPESLTCYATNIWHTINISAWTILATSDPTYVLDCHRWFVRTH